MENAIIGQQDPAPECDDYMILNKQIIFLDIINSTFR